MRTLAVANTAVPGFDGLFPFRLIWPLCRASSAKNDPEIIPVDLIHADVCPAAVRASGQLSNQAIFFHIGDACIQEKELPKNTGKYIDGDGHAPSFFLSPFPYQIKIGTSIHFIKK